MININRGVFYNFITSDMNTEAKLIMKNGYKKIRLLSSPLI